MEDLEVAESAFLGADILTAEAEPIKTASILKGRRGAENIGLGLLWQRQTKIAVSEMASDQDRSSIAGFFFLLQLEIRPSAIFSAKRDSPFSVMFVL